MTIGKYRLQINKDNELIETYQSDVLKELIYNKKYSESDDYEQLSEYVVHNFNNPSEFVVTLKTNLNELDKESLVKLFSSKLNTLNNSLINEEMICSQKILANID